MVNKKKLTEFSENPLTQYCHFLYSTMGRTLLMKSPAFKKFFQSKIYNKRYEGILKKANLKLLPEEYFFSVFITLVFSILFFLLLSIVLFFSLAAVSALIFYFGLGLVVLIGIFMYNYPVFVAKDRGQQIDAAIPYILPYLKILGRELNLQKILNIVDDFIIYKEIQIEFKRIKYYSDFLGYDIHTSIREAMASCPSRQLADLLNDLVAISNTGGNVYSYLDRKLSNLNIEIEALEKKSIDTLLIFSQIYVVILLIAPLFFTIMSAILSLVNFSAESASPSLFGGSSSVTSIIALLFFLPFAYIGFMMLIYFSKPLYSRLKPMKNE
jgi:archaellum biogenesis protein FlaJ (TadC family)